MKNILLTGATGFIGHFLAQEFSRNNKVICLIRPDTKSLARLENCGKNIKIIPHDIKLSLTKIAKEIDDIDIVLHAGANPSAADSLKDPLSIIQDNVIGTANLLEYARTQKNLKRFVYYSSGEVFGPIPIGHDSKEYDAYKSNSPYAASKASGEEFCVAYSNSFNLPVSVIHINNTFGPRCQTNRLPVIIMNKLLKNDTLEIHVGQNNLIGGRRWFYAGDVALHTRFILEKQIEKCDKWNSAGVRFINNLEFAEQFARAMNLKLNYKLVPVDRPGHDLCFSVSPEKLYKLGYKDPYSLENRIVQTVNWYRENPKWLTDK